MNNIATLFDEADGIVILAGADMSVDSGLPDFCGNTGMWTQAQEILSKWPLLVDLTIIQYWPGISISAAY